jgi:hypothetical protein
MILKNKLLCLIAMMLFDVYFIIVTVHQNTDHVLGTSAFYRCASQIYQSILLGKKYLLPAMARRVTDQLGHNEGSDGTILSVDTFHFASAGRICTVATSHCCFNMFSNFYYFF